VFDIRGLVNLLSISEPASSKLAFVNRPWDIAPDAIPREVKGINFYVTYLRRDDELDDYVYLDSYHLFLIGEAFCRMSSTHKQVIRDRRLSAKVLLSEYLKQGHKFLEFIKGNFSLVVINERPDGGHQIISSRFAVSPIYYTVKDGIFYFSTSLYEIVHSLPRCPGVDLTAIAEIALLHFPIGERTFFQNIKNILPGSVVTIYPNKVTHQYYWDLGSLYNVSLLKQDEAIEQGAELFYQCVNAAANGQSRVCTSFTAGFDSRVIHAVLEKDSNSVLAYSFGIPGSFNISIPKDICHRVGINYLPIYLTDEYQEVFNDFAFQSLILSDGMATIERANYPFAFNLLRKFSPVVITGLFGEIIRPFVDVEKEFIVKPFFVANSSMQPREVFKKYMSLFNYNYYFNKELIHRCYDEIEYDLIDNFIEKYKNIGQGKRLHLFLYKEGIRKYLGAEVQMERIYATNRFPFLDDDFVDFAFRAPFSGVHVKRMLFPTPAEKLRGQYFYAYVIKKYRPELLYNTTDHGYPPKDLLSPFAIFRVVPRFIYWRWRQKHMRYREFKTEEWTEAFYRRYLLLKPICSDLFSTKLAKDFNDGAWLINRREFARAASLKVWLEEIES